jgi:hypothetical protein
VILQRIFEHNQAEFTRKDLRSVPVIAVLEEAQSVLGSSVGPGEGPFVSWVKEGRKYDLGAVIVTQQPGSIPAEILSQGDNWFVFHLLAEGDLRALQKRTLISPTICCRPCSTSPSPARARQARPQRDPGRERMAFGDARRLPVGHRHRPGPACRPVAAPILLRDLRRPGPDRFPAGRWAPSPRPIARTDTSADHGRDATAGGLR